MNPCFTIVPATSSKQALGELGPMFTRFSTLIGYNIVVV